MKKLKELLIFIGAGGMLTIGGVLGLIGILLFSTLITAGPIILVIWVVWKLFFN